MFNKLFKYSLILFPKMGDNSHFIFLLNLLILQQVIRQDTRISCWDSQLPTQNSFYTPFAQFSSYRSKFYILSVKFRILLLITNKPCPPNSNIGK